MASFTKKHKALIPEWTKKWTDIGLSTEPANFDVAIEAALKLYNFLSFKKPNIILKVSSPYAACLGGYFVWRMLNDSNLLNTDGNMMSFAKSKIWMKNSYQVWNRKPNDLRSKIVYDIWKQVLKQTKNRESGPEYNRLTNLVSLIPSRLNNVVRENWITAREYPYPPLNMSRLILRDIEGSFDNFGRLNNFYGGCIQTDISAYFSFYRNVVGIKKFNNEFLDLNETLTLNCGWIWWHENFMIISDRPKEIHQDPANRLHSFTGPSVSFRDDWKLYHIHGTKVPKEWIENKNHLTPSIALQWKNIEQRRAACEILGWERILSELNAVTIDTDVDPEVGQLVEVEIPEIGHEKFLRVRCGTGRAFALPVPPHMTTALGANAWTFGIDENLLKQKEYRT